MRLLQIVPYLPPSISGVGDYALVLARGLRAAHGIRTTFAVANVHKEAPGDLEGFPVIALDHSPEAVSSAARDFERRLLHYVGYGYEKRGCPVWLVRGLKRWRAAEKHCQLITIFHELHAFGPPWRSSFWTHPIQRWIWVEMARMSAHCVTNTRRSQLALSAKSLQGPVLRLPVFSNFGEPAFLPACQDRKPQMVIYGKLARSRSDTQAAEKALREVVRQLKLEKVVAFGPCAATTHHLGVPMLTKGTSSAAEISDLLLQSRIGYLDYYDGCLAKSGIFAAYCAHGVAPFLLRDNHSEADELHSGHHFFSATNSRARLDSDDLQKVALNARTWYEAHSVANTVRAIAAALVLRFQ